MRGITRPRVFDWNRDGKDDLVMGTREIRVDRNLRTFDINTWFQAVDKEKQAHAKHDYDVQNHLRTTKVAVPEFERVCVPGHAERQATPVHVEFADWDGDGNVDLLAIIVTHVVMHRSKAGVDGKQEEQPEVASTGVWETHHTMVWLRNKTSTGEPISAEALPLYQVRGNIELQSFAVIDWNEDGAKEIVVSVNKKNPKNNMKVIDKQLHLLHEL